MGVDGVGCAPPHGLSIEIDAIGVMDEAIEDGVGQCGVADELVPVIDGELAGDESGGRVCSDRGARFLGGLSAGCHGVPFPGRPGGRAEPDWRDAQEMAVKFMPPRAAAGS